MYKELRDLSVRKRKRVDLTKGKGKMITRKIKRSGLEGRISRLFLKLKNLI